MMKSAKDEGEGERNLRDEWQGKRAVAWGEGRLREVNDLKMLARGVVGKSLDYDHASVMQEPETNEANLTQSLLSRGTFLQS
jgi:hypothetical protein